MDLAIVNVGSEQGIELRLWVPVKPGHVAFGWQAAGRTEMRTAKICGCRTSPPKAQQLTCEEGTTSQF